MYARVKTVPMNILCALSNVNDSSAGNFQCLSPYGRCIFYLCWTAMALIATNSSCG